MELFQKHKEFWQAFFIIFFVMGILTLSVVFYNYYSYTLKNEEHLNQAKIKVEDMTEEVFNFTVNVFKNYGRKISNLSSYSNEIKKIFNNNTHEDNPLKVWTGLSWVDKNNYLKADSIKDYEKFKKFPIRLSLKIIKEKTWEAIVSPPEIGFQSGILILPVAMGITDYKNKYIGYISAGLSLTDITKKIYDITGSIPFIILDKNYKVIAKSPNIDIRHDSFRLKKHIERNRLAINKGQVNFEYEKVLFKKVLTFPENNLIILLGIDQNFAHKEFIFEILPKIIEIFAIWIFFVLLLWIYNKRIIKKALENSWEQEQTINLIVDRVRVPLLKIHKKCLDIYEYVKKENISSNKIKMEIEQVSNDIKHLLAPILGKLSYSNIEATKIIQECLLICQSQVDKNKIKLTTKINFKKLEVEADETILRQIIIGMILLSINQTPIKGTIKIEAKIINNNNNQFLEIRVIDNGFGFSETEITQIFNRVKIKACVKKYGISPDLNSVQQLVLQHNGKLTTHKNNRGRSTVVQIPVSGASFRASNVQQFLK